MDLRAPDGARGVDVETSKGTRKLNADKSGKIKVEDGKLARKLQAEGFTVAGVAVGGFARGYPCECGFNSVFKICGKCGIDNG